MDISFRGAVSIARRVLDPIAEYVKLEPKNIVLPFRLEQLDDRVREWAFSSTTCPPSNWTQR